MEIYAENLNIASIRIANKLLEEGVSRKTRGFDCIEIVDPLLIHISNPTDRYINIKERKNHKVLPFAESLALATGVNDMSLYAGYVPSMMAYSDDGQYQRAGYGPRIRAFTGHAGEYKNSHPSSKFIYSGTTKLVDQLKFCIETLKKDLYSRQALITIHDPAKDCFGEDGNLLVTKDQPCSRSLHFQVVNDKLDILVHIRSNDFLFGFQAVNMFNFAYIQEYVANILGLNVGVYHHLADNMHFYEDKRELVEIIAAKREIDYQSEFGVWEYPKTIGDLKDFDNKVNELFQVEKNLRENKQNTICTTKFIDTEFFMDWSLVFNKYHLKSVVNFSNPYLTKLFNNVK